MRTQAFAALAFLLATPLPAAAPATPPAALLEEALATRLDEGRALAVSGLRLAAGMATVVLERGTLHPATPVGGEVREVVFLGQGRLLLDPPDEVEGGQLQLFTGQDELDQPFTPAVLVVARDAAARPLFAQPAAAPDAEAAARAALLFESWLSAAERRLLGVPHVLLLDALGEPLFDGFFAGRFETEDLGQILYVVDPEAEEPMTLGQFVPLDATEKEKRRLARLIGRQQRKGRLIDVEVEHLGDWDTWLSAAPLAADGTPLRGGPAFVVEHHTLDLTLEEGSLDVAGVARLKLRAELGGSRVAHLALSRELRLDSARATGGGDLYFHQLGDDVLVALDTAPESGETVEVELSYAGSIIERSGNVRTLRNTVLWYPQSPGVGLATYDVTFRWPRRLQLLTGGNRVEGGEDGERSWERRRIAVPVKSLSFEVGKFDVLRERAGDVDVVLAFDPSATGLFGVGDRKGLLDAVVETVTYFEEVFGPYPFQELTLVTASRFISQASPGFITLSSAAMTDHFFSIFRSLFDDRRVVVAHEVAHQWWGHVVGSRGYRDLWISEGMATYAAALYARNRLRDAGLSLTAGWQDDLLRTTPDGRPLESLGPLVLGPRLASSRSTDAYQAIVYKKGAVVLDMLARVFGEETFLRVLRSMLKGAAFRSVTTDEFFQLVERITDLDLDPFVRQFVYGTGLPEVYYDYRFERLDSGMWEITGSAEQQSPYRYIYRVVPGGSGIPDVVRERRHQMATVEDSMLIVPVQVAVYDPAKRDPSIKDPQALGNSVLVFHTLLRGERTELKMALDKEPKQFFLDARQEVFGRFFDARRHPKRILLYRALDLAGTPRTAEAAALLRQALAAEAYAGPAEADRRDLEAEAQELDARIHLLAGRLALDAGEVAAAERALTAADTARQRARSLRGYSPQFGQEAEPTLLAARLALHKGDPEAAFRLLRREVLRRGSADTPEGVLLLAVAAQASGHVEEYEDALERARNRDLDVAALEAPAGGGGVTQ